MSLENLTALEWVPKVTYTDCDVPVTFTLRIPQAAWRYRSRSQGGWAEATSGVQESFQTRLDRMLVTRLRFTEEEWVASVEPWLTKVHEQAQSFTFQLDANDVTTANTVRLVAPVGGEDIEPEPDEFSGVLELTVIMRTDDASAWSGPPYFPSLAAG